jgi:asparagine synthase (glutamine-hydrolysing)
MCGIAASISSARNLSINEMENVINLVSHRGPDGISVAGMFGSHFDSVSDKNRSEFLQSAAQVTLGHARLAILDLSHESDQPMISPDGQFAIVFNGELYNYIEIRTELKARGVNFRTSGDTEVVLNAFIEWGTSAFSRFRGMFAFVIVDSRTQTAIAVRDRFGIKPLYVWQSPNNAIHFASEIKEFTQINGWSAELNDSGAAQFLLYGLTDHSEKTLFRGVTQVLPGTYLDIKFSNEVKTSSHSWWTLSSTENFQGSFTQAADEFRERFLDSLTIHLRSDVPIGSCLSGGLDSSAIVTAAPHCIDHQSLTHLTFTASSANEKLDETRYAELVNRQVGAKGNFVTPDVNDLWNDLDQITWHQDEPFGSTSIYAQWKVFQLANKHGIKVMLDGQGADEQLGGYDSFINWRIVDLLRHGRVGKARAELKAFDSKGRTNLFNVIQTLAYVSLPQSIVRGIGSRMGVASQNAGGWVSESFLEHANASDPFKMLNGRSPKNVRELSHSMLSSSNLPMLLRFEDRNSMAFGVESRVPFLDHELVEFVTSLPSEYLVSEGNTKRILTKGLAGFIPQEIIERKDKIGFQTSEATWFTKNSTMILDRIQDTIEESNGLITKNAMEVSRNMLSNQSKYSYVPWRIVSFGAWAKRFKVKI